MPTAMRSPVGHTALICYAAKANSNLAVLNLFARLGAGFDIVSGGELARILAAGGEAKKVVLSGVCNGREEIAQLFAGERTLPEDSGR
ncbi:MAG: hypothetical protein WAO76_02045 [Georgfuchsia sp.]